MEHFLEEIAPLRHWYINPNEKSNKYKSSLLSKLTKALMEHFLQGNVPLRHLLNAKPLFMFWWRSAIKEVNDWALSEVASSPMTSKPWSWLYIELQLDWPGNPRRPLDKVTKNTNVNLCNFSYCRSDLLGRFLLSCGPWKGIGYHYIRSTTRGRMQRRYVLV